MRAANSTRRKQPSPAPPPGYEAGSGENAIPVEATMSGLAPATTYYYQVVATNRAGTREGSDKTPPST
jgi:phosphodiesterase/alkaline phosphatase D-like protein